VEGGGAGRARRAGWGWYLLLVIPFIGTLFPGMYNSIQPTLDGMPFYYWYQLLWVVITALLTLIVYLATR
jgi:hypothetical protein